MFDNVTLLIATRNRHPYLTRILDYYSDSGLPILVGDSSSCEFPKKEDYEGITYLFFKDYIYYKKVAEVVHTKYVVMCADDDFIVPSAIQHGVAFLETHSDYSSVQGRAVYFVQQPPHILVGPLYRYAWNIDINGDQVIDRIIQQFSLYMNQFYSIHRTENLKKSFEIAQEIQLKSMNVIELLIAFVAIIYGKHRVLPIFYHARERLPGSVGSTALSMKTFRTNPAYQAEFTAFVDRLTELLASTSKLNKKEAQAQVLSGLDAYTNLWLSQNHTPTRLVSNLRRIKNYLPVSLRKTYQLYRLNRMMGTIHNPQPVTFLDEWRKIEAHITRYET